MKGQLKPCVLAIRDKKKTNKSKISNLNRDLWVTGAGKGWVFRQSTCTSQNCITSKTTHMVDSVRNLRTLEIICQVLFL